MNSEKDILESYIHFDPPLYSKGARKHQVYLIPKTGSILKGRLKGITLHNKMDKILRKKIQKIDLPSILHYDNRPEFSIQEFPITDLTREALSLRIREEFDNESRRIRETSSWSR